MVGVRGGHHPRAFARRHLLLDDRMRQLQLSGQTKFQSQDTVSHVCSRSEAKQSVCVVILKIDIDIATSMPHERDVRW